MSKDAPQWTLGNLVDFEQAAAASASTPPDVRRAVSAAAHGLEGAEARRRGLRVWLEKMPPTHAGRKFLAALTIVTAGLSTVAFLAGISTVLGLMDRERGGVNVTHFLGILIGGQWLILLFATLAWLVRSRAKEGLSVVQMAAAKLARRLAGRRDIAWWDRLTDAGGAPRAALVWRLARLAQTAGISFNIGILASLAGLVMLKHVGFFWETTTELAMRSALEITVDFLSAPWATAWPEAAPDIRVIAGSRWLPGRTTGLAPGPREWWLFLLMATLVWGLLPRAILWLVAWWAGRGALSRLDFQARHHRALWREITGTERAQTDEKPLDGVLVLDVGGSGIAADALRPFLLRRLRVHPAVWRSIAVLDPGAEVDASQSLAKAPAGVVLLAEGWSLSPPRMASLHAKIRFSAGQETPVKFLVANAGVDNQPVPATEEECREWVKFVDSLRDPAAEVFFFEED